jgi:hypothetical protein
MKRFAMPAALAAVLGLLIASAVAQPARPGHGPAAVDDERMIRMMAMMGQMRGMVTDHRARMMQQCPAAGAPAAPAEPGK